MLRGRTCCGDALLWGCIAVGDAALLWGHMCFGDACAVGRMCYRDALLWVRMCCGDACAAGTHVMCFLLF